MKPTVFVTFNFQGICFAMLLPCFRQRLTNSKKFKKLIVKSMVLSAHRIKFEGGVSFKTNSDVEHSDVEHGVLVKLIY